MTVDFNAALSAYSNAAKFSSNISPASESSGSGSVGFANIIGDSASGATSKLRHAESTIAKSLVKQADITDVVTAISNAEVTLRTVIQVRDKLIAAHQEIMRMPI